MAQYSSSKELVFSNNEKLSLNNGTKSLFRFPQVKNFFSKYLEIYTFNAGFKKKRDDILIIVFKNLVKVSAVYSKTSTPSAPIIWDKKNNRGYCKILIVNSGNANAHTGKEGLRAIDYYTNKISKKYQCPQSQILVSSTGVIGEQLDYKKIIKTYDLIDSKKSKDLLSAAKSIMTTDTYSKTILKEIKIGGQLVRIYGIAKGSGMICPNMGTMLAYIFIEANISNILLKKMLHSHLDSSFNSISVDGDTSTSDTFMLFLLGDKKGKKLLNKGHINKISSTLKLVMSNLALQVISDGEGISKLIRVNVFGAINYTQASVIAFSIANSPLVKTAVAGEDANWGRVIMAIGKSNKKVTQDKINLKFGNLTVATKGKMYNKINFKKLDNYMKNNIIEINLNLNLGKFKRIVFASDLTHEYIKINADYRS